MTLHKFSPTSLVVGRSPRAIIVTIEGDFLARIARPRSENVGSADLRQETQAARYDPKLGQENTEGAVESTGFLFGLLWKLESGLGAGAAFFAGFSSPTTATCFQ